MTNACDPTSIFSKALFRLGILYQILNLQCGDKVPFTIKLVDVGLGNLHLVLVLSYCDNTPTTIYLVDQVQVHTCLDEEPFTIYLIYVVVTRHSLPSRCVLEDS